MRDRIGGERGWPPMRASEFEQEIEQGSLYVGSPETVAKKIAATAGVLNVVWGKLPEITKTEATAITNASQAKVKEKITLVLAIPGVKEKIQPVLTEITEGLAKFTN